MSSTTTELQSELINVYGQLLLDVNLVFAVVLAWALTHFIKQYPGIKAIKPLSKKKWIIRVISACVGFLAVMFLKRDLIGLQTDEVFNIAVVVAFVHPVLYKVFTGVLDKFAPSISQHLKSK